MTSIKSFPQAKPLYSTNTQAPASPVEAHKSASPAAQPQKAATSTPALHQKDLLGAPKSPSENPEGQAVFKSKADVQTLNARRGSVYAARGTPSPPNAPPSPTETTSNALAQKHNVNFGVKILQGDAGRLAGDAVNEFARTRNGVCIAISSDWIRANLTDDKQNSSTNKDIFKSMVEPVLQSNGTYKTELNPHFVHMQNESAEAINGINSLVETQQNTFDTLVDANNRYKAQQAQAGQPPSTLSSISSFFSKPPPPVTDADLQQHLNNYQSAQKAADGAKAAELSRLVGGVSAGTVESKGKDFDTLKQDFTGQFQKDGYYQVSIFTQDGRGGHDIAVQMGAQPRLLDPNTGEWTFRDKAQMNAFMKDYTQTFYPGYAAGTFNATHYPA
ncbi:YopT-type cysteine protease domain-containing protein [Myxococcus landrumensis]|uniref:Peptidase C58 YopT-type domain-containing protein n=1 Tax=Myxococcus landrumensis TaxID=2813577 RepID=A0ABX7N7T4_9BACT|nr:YopT-type cysteine protease domain-containing protein [Myxococcus landrumus]QSQ14775.1 hypothetical protein JY572_01410 [Myxococcus landrumus]